MKLLQTQAKQEIKAKEFKQGFGKISKILSLEEQNLLTGHFCKLKIRDYNENQFKEVATALKLISVNSGVNEPLEDWASLELLKFIKTEFKDFSFTEIREAFAKYNAGKLSFSTGAYQNFSQKFVADVLNAYKSFRNKALLKYYKELERVESEKPLKPEEVEAIEEDFINNCLYKPYEKALKNKTEVVFDDAIASSILLKMLKKGVLMISKEETIQFKVRSRKSLKQSLKNDLTMNNKTSINNLIEELKLEEVGPSAERKIKERASKLYLEQFINGKLRAGATLESIKF